MRVERLILSIAFIYVHITVLPQINMEHVKAILDDYYSDLRQDDSIRYCNLIQIDQDSLIKYYISDKIQPFPVVPPDSFLFTNDSIVVYYYYTFPPDIAKNYQTLNSLKIAYEQHFNSKLGNEKGYVLYDPPESAYLFHATDTMGLKIEYDPHGTAILIGLLEYYKSFSNQ
jgi:hypothetical protein